MITPLLDSKVEYVKQIINQNKLVYNEFDIADAINSIFFEVRDSKTNKFVGFFALAPLDEVKEIEGSSKELCLCYVFIKPNCRNHGYFNEIVEYSKNYFDNSNSRFKRLQTNASVDLEPANTIYRKKFAFAYQGELKGHTVNFYVIKEK